MRVGVVDIGTNSMRLLITDGIEDVGRWVEVTGLGRDVDATGRLSSEGVRRTLAVLESYGRLMDDAGVVARKAIATSATREASNRDPFLARAETALGVRPSVITGEEEARLAFKGAVRDLSVPRPVMVCDIGGGSTELVTESQAVSIDIGSVRLTERQLPDRPARRDQLEGAVSLVDALLEPVEIGEVRTLVGVAGTWTSLGAMARGLRRYRTELVHGRRVTATEIEHLVDRLATLTVEDTAQIPALDPARAPVILAGAVVAWRVMLRVGSAEAIVSERDTLDGVATELLAIA